MIIVCLFLISLVWIVAIIAWGSHAYDKMLLSRDHFKKELKKILKRSKSLDEDLYDLGIRYNSRRHWLKILEIHKFSDEFSKKILENEKIREIIFREKATKEEQTAIISILLLDSSETSNSKTLIESNNGEVCLYSKIADIFSNEFLSLIPHDLQGGIVRKAIQSKVSQYNIDLLLEYSSLSEEEKEAILFDPQLSVLQKVKANFIVEKINSINELSLLLKDDNYDDDLKERVVRKLLERDKSFFTVILDDKLISLSKESDTIKKIFLMILKKYIPILSIKTQERVFIDERLEYLKEDMLKAVVFSEKTYKNIFPNLKDNEKEMVLRKNISVGILLLLLKTNNSEKINEEILSKISSKGNALSRRRKIKLLKIYGIRKFSGWLYDFERLPMGIAREAMQVAIEDNNEELAIVIVLHSRKYFFSRNKREAIQRHFMSERITNALNKKII